MSVTCPDSFQINFPNLEDLQAVFPKNNSPGPGSEKYEIHEI